MNAYTLEELLECFEWSDFDMKELYAIRDAVALRIFRTNKTRHERILRTLQATPDRVACVARGDTGTAYMCDGVSGPCVDCGVAYNRGVGSPYY